MPGSIGIDPLNGSTDIIIPGFEVYGGGTPMAAVSEDRREVTLREWGVSEPLIRLSCGDKLHPLFSDSHEGPPWYVYRGEIGVPKGPAFAAL
jgi:hypothetical protein